MQSRVGEDPPHTNTIPPPSPAVVAELLHPSAHTVPSLPIPPPPLSAAAGFEDKTAYAQCIFAYTPGRVIRSYTVLAVGIEWVGIERSEPFQQGGLELIV